MRVLPRDPPSAYRPRGPGFPALIVRASARKEKTAPPTLFRYGGRAVARSCRRALRARRSQAREAEGATVKTQVGAGDPSGPERLDGSPPAQSPGSGRGAEDESQPLSRPRPAGARERPVRSATALSERASPVGRASGAPASEKAVKHRPVDTKTPFQGICARHSIKCDLAVDGPACTCKPSYWGAATPPGSCRNTASRLRQRRSELPCPSVKLSTAGLSRGGHAHDPITSLPEHFAGRGIPR